MVFSSITFLFYFLPIVLIIYYLVPSKIKNYILLLSSILFYFYGEPKYVLLMIISIILTYTFALLIDKYRETNFKKTFLILSIIVNLGLLIYFKYVDFLIENINAIFNTKINLIKVVLPIGISFYTFQIISYLIDVYRNEVKVQRNIFDLATYVTLFPQLIAGPIVRYKDIENQLHERKHNIKNIALGIRRFVIGLGKKVLIANVLGELVNIFLTSNDKSILFFWIYGIANMLQIYFDFSGYSDMAIGIAKMFGFELLENFNYPYISNSITEFWRRWHMSLSMWFRDYVYIPLGGNRVSKIKHLRNIMIVWLLTRIMAWCCLEFRNMGYIFWSFINYRKTIYIKTY